MSATAISRGYPLPGYHNDHNIYWVSEGAITMRSQFLLDLSDPTSLKPSIHAASRDFDPADFCLLLARSQHLKGLVGGACRPVPPAPACRGASRGSRALT